MHHKKNYKRRYRLVNINPLVDISKDLDTMARYPHIAFCNYSYFRAILNARETIDALIYFLRRY